MRGADVTQADCPSSGMRQDPAPSGPRPLANDERVRAMRSRSGTDEPAKCTGEHLCQSPGVPGPQVPKALRVAGLGAHVAVAHLRRRATRNERRQYENEPR
jgi:hypothetical protein